MNTIVRTILVCGVSVLLSACAPEVGSEKWCQALKEKPKGEWTANELADFTKHCIF
ncbi:MAG: DUF3012 domain-containing protein [Burkholderiales bacterium]